MLRIPLLSATAAVGLALLPCRRQNVADMVSSLFRR